VGVPESSEILSTERRGGSQVSQADIDEFKATIRAECGVEMSDREAWNRVIELRNMYRNLLGPIPEDPGLHC
jgi:hypothetical protein